MYLRGSGTVVVLLGAVSVGLLVVPMGTLPLRAGLLCAVIIGWQP